MKGLIIAVMALTLFGCDVHMEPRPYTYKVTTVTYEPEPETIVYYDYDYYYCDPFYEEYYVPYSYDPVFCTDYGTYVGYCCTWPVDSYYSYCEEEWCFWEDVCAWEPGEAWCFD